MKGYPTQGSSDDSNGSVIAFRTADLYAEQDERRMAELDRMVKANPMRSRPMNRCRGCGKRAEGDVCAECRRKTEHPEQQGRKRSACHTRKG